MKNFLVRKGFSLIELLIVIAIIGVLAAVAIPAYQAYLNNARKNMAEGSINQIKKAFPACFAVNGFSTCANEEINNTLKEQAGADIEFKSTANKKACWQSNS